MACWKSVLRITFSNISLIMDGCFLVFKGWDSPDSSPALEKVFGTYEKALAYVKELQDAETKRHMDSCKDRVDRSCCWHDMPVWGGCHKWYQTRQFVRFGLSQEDIAEGRTWNDEMCDETIYIERREIE